MRKYIGKSKEYKNVYVNYSDTEKIYYYSANVRVGDKHKQKDSFKTEREAAKWVDLRLIEGGKEPVNVLKRK